MEGASKHVPLSEVAPHRRTRGPDQVRKDQVGPKSGLPGWWICPHRWSGAVARPRLAHTHVDGDEAFLLPMDVADENRRLNAGQNRGTPNPW